MHFIVGSKISMCSPTLHNFQERIEHRSYINVTPSLGTAIALFVVYQRMYIHVSGITL